jgi:hypothetical protein
VNDAFLFVVFKTSEKGSFPLGKQSHRVLTPLHSNKAFLCRTSFCGFQNEREGKLSARKAVPTSFDIPALQQSISVPYFFLWFSKRARREAFRQESSPTEF